MNKNLILLNKLKQGDPQAVQEWFEKYHDDMLNIAKKKVKSNADAQEIVQETFINCLKNLHTFNHDSKFKTWMYSILRHEIADYFRKLYAKKAIKTIPLSDLFFQKKIYNAHQTSVKVKQALKKMQDFRKELLYLKYVDKKKVKEIAQHLGKSIKSVESELYRARQEFKKQYVLVNDID